MNSIALMVVGAVAVSIGGAVVFAQSRDMSKDRNDPSRARRAPASKVRLKTATCLTPDCIAVQLDELGAVNGVSFASVPLADAGERLQGTLCTCDLRACHEDRDAGWDDTNPVPSGWGVVNINRSRVWPARLRKETTPNTWVIRWDGRALPFYSWNVFISKSSAPQKLNVIVCPSGSSQP